MISFRTAVASIVILVALAGRSAFAQQASNGNGAPPAPAAPPAGDEAADVAKQLSNPIANLVSIPFQFNWEGHIAPFNSTRFLLNVQPVVPFTLNEHWNLITDRGSQCSCIHRFAEALRLRFRRT